jgi:BirA family transcriptional regulator, biotin operon repressor / biotin---[acetyl-CoA-carboxylase] ligase
VTLGRPRLHLRSIGSTMDRARELAIAGAPHGTLVSADVQTAGRGRYARTWSAPAGTALLFSLIVREFDPLLPLRVGLAVADVAGAGARVKWPNDVWLEGLKVAGILVEGRPAAGWAVAGVGLNVALDVRDLPQELHATAGTLGRSRDQLEPTLTELLTALEAWLAAPVASVVAALRERDALLGQRVDWADGDGVGAGIDDAGRLLVRRDDGELLALDAGEVLLRAAGA